MPKTVPLREKLGFDIIGMRLLRALAYPIYGCRCKLPEYITKTASPIVFVCNHYEMMFGPLSAIVSLPLRFRVWATDMFGDPEKNIKRLVARGKQVFSVFSDYEIETAVRLLLRPIRYIFRKLQAIPVYLDSPEKTIRTFKISLESLIKGESIVLFPEKLGSEGYPQNGVNEFRKGFALLGEYYQRKTGQPLNFCPVYIDKRRRRFEFGELVIFEKSTDRRSACADLSENLQREMTRICEQCSKKRLRQKP